MCIYIDKSMNILCFYTHCMSVCMYETSSFDGHCSPSAALCWPLVQEKRQACQRYEDKCTELGGVKERSEREIHSLKEHLRLARAALQEGQNLNLGNSLNHWGSDGVPRPDVATRGRIFVFLFFLIPIFFMVHVSTCVRLHRCLRASATDWQRRELLDLYVSGSDRTHSALVFNGLKPKGSTD